MAALSLLTASLVADVTTLAALGKRQEIERWLKSEKIDILAVFEAIQRVLAIDPNCLFSINFLLAQDDYNNFTDMMLEYKHAFLWEEPAVEEDVEVKDDSTEVTGKDHEKTAEKGDEAS